MLLTNEQVEVSTCLVSNILLTLVLAQHRFIWSHLLEYLFLVGEDHNWMEQAFYHFSLSFMVICGSNGDA